MDLDAIVVCGLNCERACAAQSDAIADDDLFPALDWEASASFWSAEAFRLAGAR